MKWTKSGKSRSFVGGVAVADLVGQRASTRSRDRAESAEPRDMKRKSYGLAQPKKKRKSSSFGTGSRTEPEPSEPAAAVSDAVPLRAGQTNPIKARNQT